MDEINKLSRRTLITRAAALPALGVGVATGLAAQQPATGFELPGVPEWTTRQGGTFVNPPYGLPSPFEKDVVRVLPGGNIPFQTASRTPLHRIHGTITPNGLFFERQHAGVPTIDPDKHRLMVHGLVDRPLVLTMDDVVRFPSVSRIHFLECSGNSAAQY